MLERHLRIRLRPISERARMLDLWKNLGWAWGLAFFAAFGLYWLRSHGEPPSFTWLAAVLILGVSGTGIAFYRFTRFSLNFKQIAETLAEKHPDVRSMLMAAVEQKSNKEGGRLNYLQECVLEEAIQHAKTNRWIQTISSQKLLYTASFSLWMGIGFLFFLYQLIILDPGAINASPQLTADENPAVPDSPQYKVTVEPGNAEVEKGTGLVVMARFEGGVPEAATLILGEGKDHELRLSMTRNLGDPIYGVRIPEITSNNTYRIEFPEGQSETFQINTYEHPSLQVADARITPPGYTRLPVREMKDVRTVSLPEGANVTFTFTLNKPVMGAWLTPKNGEPVRLEQDAKVTNLYRASLSPPKSIRYQLDLMDDDGRRNKLPPRFAINILPNKIARLKVLFPRGDKRVSPLQEIEFEAEVSDDFGLGSYGLTYTLPGVSTRELVLSNPGASLIYKAKAQYLLALEELNVKPDQLLTWYFWAEDTGPNGQSRRHEGDMYFAEVRPFEEIYREGMSQSSEEIPGTEKKQLAEKLANQQKLIINATWKLKRQADNAIPKTFLQDVELIRQSQAQLRQETEEAMEQFDDPEVAEDLGKAAGFMKTAMDQLENAADNNTAKPLDPALTAEQRAFAQLLKLRAREFIVSQSQKGKGKGQSSQGQRNEEQLRNLDIKKKEQRYETANQNQQQDQEKREDHQALSRLKELAQRQNDLAEKLKDLQTALQEAKTEEERKELQRQLKRLREEQRRMLADLDELRQRVQQPENRERNRQASKQLEKTREKMTDAADALQNRDLDKAVNSTTRAQRDLENLRDDFRKKVSSRFSEEMREMRKDAGKLDEKQKQLTKDLQAQREAKGRRLVDNHAGEKLADRTQEQKTRAGDIIKQMQEVTEQSETSEPLLSRKLYESLRRNSSGELEKNLETTSELLKRSFLPQAEQSMQAANQGVEQLRKDVEDAAKSVLGDTKDSLRRARKELEQLRNKVQQEIAQKTEQAKSGKSKGQANQNSESKSQTAANQNSRQDQSGKDSAKPSKESEDKKGEQASLPDKDTGEGNPQQPGETGKSQEQQASGQTGKQPREGQQSNPGKGSPQGQQSIKEGQGEQPSQNAASGQSKAQTGQTKTASNQSGQPSSNEAPQPGAPSNKNPQRGQRGSQTPFEAFGGNTGGPMTGRDYLQWSDRLRDVEEMVDSEELRKRAATIRDQARSIRREFKRHGKDPEWDMVSKQIAEPLAELHDLVREELMKMESGETPVPIDRDPVPERFSDLVEKYYKELGKGERPDKKLE
jgi:hypothetical protein